MSPSPVSPPMALAGAPQAMASLGRVLGPSPPENDCWDRYLLSGPVVVAPGTWGRPQQAAPAPTSDSPHGSRPAGAGVEGEAARGVPESKWRMYYSGRDTVLLRQGVVGLKAAGAGRVGLALSDDGVHWERYKGPLEGGAIFDPSTDEGAFDTAHVSVSDVIPPSADVAEWRMFYWGGGPGDNWTPPEGLSLEGRPPVPTPALPFRTGMAVSADGVAFERRNQPVLWEGPLGSFDDFLVYAPKVLPPAHASLATADEGKAESEWFMTYQSLGKEETGGVPKTFYVACGAQSRDGEQWEKTGVLLSAGPPGSWDEGGIGVHHKFVHKGKYYMLYTGVARSPPGAPRSMAIGLASSIDGAHWVKAEGVGAEPGGPVFKPQEAPAWDADSVHSPYVVPGPAAESSALWMYYTGCTVVDGTTVNGIGLAVSADGDCSKWERYYASA